MAAGKTVNTDILYHTIGHEHLISLVFWAMNEMPTSGLNIVECITGVWFVEVDIGSDFDSIEGISKPDLPLPYKVPLFFDSEKLAKNFAFECIEKVYPKLKNMDLNKYYSD